MQVINIKDKLSQFSDYWSPKIVGEMNDDKVQVVKLNGEFHWHHHEEEEELFWVIEGQLLIHFRDKTVTLNPGEMIIIPKMVEHKPEAPEEVSIVLIEPKSTVNTGNVETENTVVEQDRL